MMAVSGDLVRTVCGVCGRQGECLRGSLTSAAELKCPGCGRTVKPNQYQLLRITNANERSPRLTITLTPVEQREDIAAASGSGGRQEIIGRI
jgi:hypothetical protein